MNVGAVGWQVEVFTSYQVVSGEMQVRGRFQQHLNDAEPYVTIRGVATVPLLAGAPRLQSIAEGLLNKAAICAVRTVEAEPPHPDELPDLVRRFVYFQGMGFTAKGSAEFPAAADPTLHREMLFKARFFPLVEATVSVIGADAPPMSWPLAYVNRDLMVGIYLA